MKYEKLSNAEQQAILEARIYQAESEHYAHSLNLENLKASPGATAATPDTAIVSQIKAAEDAIATLDRAHAKSKSELAAVKSRAPVEPGTPGGKP